MCLSDNDIKTLTAPNSRFCISYYETILNLNNYNTLCNYNNLVKASSYCELMRGFGVHCQSDLGPLECHVLVEQRFCCMNSCCSVCCPLNLEVKDWLILSSILGKSVFGKDFAPLIGVLLTNIKTTARKPTLSSVFSLSANNSPLCVII